MRTASARKHQRAASDIRFPDQEFPFLLINSKIHGITGHDYHQHTDFVELLYIRSGTGFYYIKDRFYPLRPHTLFIIHSGETHSFISHKRDDYSSRSALIFSKDIFDLKAPLSRSVVALLFRCGKNSRHQIHFDNTLSPTVEMILAAIEREYRARGTHYTQVITHLLQALFAQSLRAAELRESRSDELSPGVRRAVDCIEHGFASSLTLRDVAQAAGLSSCHLSHVFKDEMQLTFKQYLVTRRIFEAKRLLESGDERKMLAISFACGFSSLRNFDRNFRAFVGMTPSQYREFCQVKVLREGR